MSRTRGAGRSGPGALRSEAAVRPAEPGAAERHRADRGAADPHRPDRDAAALDGTDRGAADLHGTDRGAADLHGTDRDAADLRPIDPGVPAGADPAAPLRAVVADDHPVVRDGLVAMLGSDPEIEVVGVAADGRQALAVIADTDPDVVLMDLRMPGGGGAESIRALREHDRTRPRILVLTTYDTDRDIRSALEAGADGFLLKDTRRDDVIRAVHDLAGGRAVLAPAALAALTGADPRAELSRREVEVLRLVADGCTNRAVATRLGIGEATVKTHLVHVYEKLGVGDRASAVRTAWELGLV